mgnify:CR=1 FL=1
MNPDFSFLMMSNYFQGVTFASQSVAPIDDAQLNRAMLPDGILSGCSITYSGSTLTLAAGYMIACGRIFQITAARNWAVVDATSGVARLVLTIDLTKTATESAFDQISFGIEYASAENGFVNLTQDDINVAGTRYQVTVAVVSLGAGGITGIVSQMEKSRAEGGGLNFRVVGGETQPNDPKENDIWVITPVKIPAYYLQAEQPEEMDEGDVWISTGAASSVAFNAAKKGTVMLYPLAVKQMVGGVLVNRAAEIRRDGEWVQFSFVRFYLFKAGQGIADGYDAKASYGASAGGMTVDNDKIIMSASVGLVNPIWFEPPVALKSFKKLCVDLICTGKYADSSAVTIGVGSDIPSGTTIGAVDASITSIYDTAQRVYELPVSNISSERYIKILAYGVTGSIYNIWLE